MNPIILNNIEENNVLKFTIQNINVSLINALRRIILGDIPCVILKTFPYAENNVDIEVNTTRMNNELIKQRLSCIPIHINDTEFPIQNYIIELDKTNLSDYIQYATTKDIKIKDIVYNTYLSEEETRKIFPPNHLSNDFIDIVRLRPKMRNDHDGEQLKFTAKLDIGSANDNGSYNVACTSCYSNTPDETLIQREYEKYVNSLEDNIEDETRELKKKDWLILNSQKYFIKDSFNFILETVGQFSNNDIMLKACGIMLEKINKFRTDLQNDVSLISKSNVTIDNCYDIKILNEDYTIGKALEYILYTFHYLHSDNETSDKTVSFCGFRKNHPHDDFSYIRVAFINNVDENYITELFNETCNKLELIYQNIFTVFE